MLCGYLLVLGVGDRYDPRSILVTEIEPVASAPGTFISIVYTVKDERECSGVVHRWIVDSQGMIHALSDTGVFHDFYNPPKGEPYQFSRDVRIPRNIAAGPAVYYAKTERWCNPLQQWFWPIIDGESAEFNVIRGVAAADPAE